MKKQSFEIFSTTADIGFIAWGADIPEVFVQGANALAEIISDPQKVRPNKAVSVKIEAHDWPELVVNWLSEILYQQEVREMFFSRFVITDFAPYSFRAELWGEDYAPDRHDMKHEVKAITYHDLSLTQEVSGQWRLKVLVDI